MRKRRGEGRGSRPGHTRRAWSISLLGDVPMIGPRRASAGACVAGKRAGSVGRVTSGGPSLAGSVPRTLHSSALTGSTRATLRRLQQRARSPLRRMMHALVRPGARLRLLFRIRGGSIAALALHRSGAVTAQRAVRNRRNDATPRPGPHGVGFALRRCASRRLRSSTATRARRSGRRPSRYNVPDAGSSRLGRFCRDASHTRRLIRAPSPDACRAGGLCQPVESPVGGTI